MAAIVVLLVLIATALLGASIPHQPFVDPATQTGGSFSDPAACRPTLDNDSQMRVNVDPSVAHLYTAANPANDPDDGLDFDKTDDEWVLIKKDAAIPAWKVLLRTHDRGDKMIAEMERIGTAEALTGGAQGIQGNDVYIGTGWCNPNDGEDWDFGDELNDTLDEDEKIEYCLDPLVQDALFVLKRQGATDITEPFINESGWPAAENPVPPRTQENIDKYYWSFDVYYKESNLPPNPTTEDLPCWIEMQCYQNYPVEEAIQAKRRFERAEDGSCEIVQSESTNSLAQTTEQDTDESVLGFTVYAGGLPTPLSLGAMNITNPPADITLAQNYTFSTQLTTPPDVGGMDEFIGTINNPSGTPEFNIYIRRGNIAETPAEYTLIFDPTPAGHPEGPYLMYAPHLDSSAPNAKSLQLGSFIPGVPAYYYEWWTPSCKPALYLYPEKNTELSVFVQPNGHIIESIPEHGPTGWRVIAQPDGTLFEKNNNQLSMITSGYLYYEAAINNVSVPKDHGWIRKTDQLPVFFADVLPKLGLNETEAADFTEYWVPKLAHEGNRWFITLIDESEINRTEPIAFSVQPDTFHRIRFYFENIDTKPLFQNPNPYPLTSEPPARTGFTVIDWGGIIGNGSCGLVETSQ